jgi:urease accessory protein UreH
LIRPLVDAARAFIKTQSFGRTYRTEPNQLTRCSRERKDWLATV